MEQAVDFLCQRFHNVVALNVRYNVQQIRFRADLLKEQRVWWNKTDRQRALWRERGGVLLSWKTSFPEGDNDALFCIECPRKITVLDYFLLHTKSVCCIYNPPTWRLHEETARLRHPGNDQQWQMDNLHRMRDLLEKSPTLTLRALDRLLARQAESQSLSAPGSPAGEGPTSDSPPAVPAE